MPAKAIAHILKRVQFNSVTQSCPTLCDQMKRSTPGLPVHHQLLEFSQTRFHRVSDAIQPSHPLSSPSPAPNISQHQSLFQWVNSSHEVAKDWSYSFSIIPSKEIPRLISRMDWLDLLAVQGTLKSLLQLHSSKASILQHSAFFIVQLSHPYMTTGKTIALTRQTFVGKVTSLLLNMLSRLVMTFPPRSKRLLISRLQSPSHSALTVPPFCHNGKICILLMLEYRLIVCIYHIVFIHSYVGRHFPCFLAIVSNVPMSVGMKTTQRI